MKKNIFVCNENTACSSLAEFIMKHIVQEAGLDSDIGVSSAGFRVREGRELFEGVISVLEKHHISFTEHKTRQFSFDNYKNNDYTVVLDAKSRMTVEKISGEKNSKKIKLLMSFTGDKHDFIAPVSAKEI